MSDTRSTTDIRRLLEAQRAAFIGEGPVCLEIRRARLQKVIDLLVKHNDALCQAMGEDFEGRPFVFSMMNDVLGSLAALKVARDKLQMRNATPAVTQYVADGAASGGAR